MPEPLMIRLLSASVAVANRSGRIIREVLKTGQLGIVQKVWLPRERRASVIYGCIYVLQYWAALG